jgi:hypothetical protein
MIRHPQFSTKKSRIIKTLNLSVVREQNHFCLAAPVLDAPACDHIAHLRTCLFAAKPHHQRSPASDNVHNGAYKVDNPRPRSTTEGTVLLPVGTSDLRAP